MNTLAGGAIGGVVGYINAETACFIAGTLVRTEEGDRPIEEIRKGDRVLAWDEATQEASLKKVLETYIRESEELVHLTAGGEKIVTTPEHPFWALRKGWTKAAELRAGDILQTVNGEYVIVEQIQHEILESPVRVYNFQVEDYHTYCVSEHGVVVHNSCGDIGSYKSLKKTEKGSGNEVHHIVEKRFIYATEYTNQNEMPGVSLEKATHQMFTNAWRTEIPYGIKATRGMIIEAAKVVYSNHPDLLSIAIGILK